MTLMLGTNDLKSRFAVQPLDIAESVGILLETIAKSDAGPNGKAPRVLLIAPPPLAKLTFLGDMVIAPFFVMPTVSALIWKNLLMHPVQGLFAWFANLLGMTRCSSCVLS